MSAWKQTTFSPCRTYRYTLVRILDPLLTEASPPVVSIGLNPSLANEHRSDPTITRELAFARSLNACALLKANLYALVSPYPKDLLTHPDPVGPNNDDVLRAIPAGAIVVCSWGAHKMAKRRAEAVLELLRGRDLRCFGRTKDGFPRHPLYLPNPLTLEAFA